MNGMQVLLISSYLKAAVVGDPQPLVSLPNATVPGNSREICGVSASSVADLRGKISGASGTATQPVGNGYVVYIQEPLRRYWTFTTPANRAYPAAVCRSIVTRDGVSNVSLEVMCDADRDPCEALRREFFVLSERMKRDLIAR